MLQKIVKACLYLSVFLMPLFWLPFSVEAFEFNKIYLLFVLVSVGLLAWLARMIFKEQKFAFRKTSLDFFVLGYLAIMIIAGFFSADKISTWLGFYGRFWPSLLGTLCLGGFYFLFVNNVSVRKSDKSDNKTLGLAAVLKTFLVSSFVVSIAGIFSLCGVWLQMAKIWGGRLPSVMTLRFFNPSGGSLEALAVFLASVLALMVVLLSLKNRIDLFKTENPKKPGRFTAWLYAFTFIDLALLVVLRFRMAWLVLFLSLLVFLVFSFWKRILRDEVHKLSLPFFLALLSLVLFFYNPINSLIPANSFLGNLPSEVFLTQKLSWNLAGQEIAGHPVFGEGLSNFSNVFSKFKPQAFLGTQFWQLRFDRAGSAIAEFAATTGILGILAYLLLIGMFFTIAYFFIASVKKKGDSGEAASALKKEDKLLVLPFLIGFAAFFFSQIVYYQNTALAFSFWLILAMGVVSWGPAIKEKNISFKDFPELGLILSIVFWVALLGVIFVYFSLGKYYLADAYYRQYLASPGENFGELEKAGSLAPSRSAYQIALAGAYLQKSYQEAAKPQPDRQLIANFIALSVSAVKKATLQNPRDVASHEASGVVYREIQGGVSGARDWAIKSFETALALEPKNPVLKTELAKLYLAGNDLEKARQFFSQAVELKPDYAEAQLSLASLDDQQGKTEEAQARLENLVRIAPFSVEAHFQLGRIYFNAKEYQRAQEQFQAAVALFPNHSNSLYSLGLVYEKQGEAGKALEMYEKVLELNPGNKDIESKIDELQNPVSAPAPATDKKK